MTDQRRYPSFRETDNRPNTPFLSLLLEGYGGCMQPEAADRRKLRRETSGPASEMILTDQGQLERSDPLRVPALHSGAAILHDELQNP